MEGTDVARDNLSVLLVDFKLFDCNDSAKESFLFGVTLSAPVDAEGKGGGGGGGGRKPMAIGGGGGGGPPNIEGGGGGGGGIGVAGMLP